MRAVEVSELENSRFAGRIRDILGLPKHEAANRQGGSLSDTPNEDQMQTRFRPIVETLDERTLPSAVTAAAYEPSYVALATAAQAADTDSADQDDSIMAKKNGGKSGTKTGAGTDTYMKITLSDVLISNYN